MKKAEFMKQENVPQFIKDMIKSVPDDADIGFSSLCIKHGKNDDSDDEAESCGCESCSCDDDSLKSYPDGLDITSYLDTIVHVSEYLINVTDGKCRVAREDVDCVLGYVDVLSGTVSQLFNYLSSYQEARDSLREGTDE